MKKTTKQSFTPPSVKSCSSEHIWRAGFTLIELIVVVIIIGVLASIVVPSYVRTREKAMDKQAQVILVLVRAAERRFKMERGYYFNISSSTDIPVANINNNLSLDLVDDGNWEHYRIYTSPTGGSGFRAEMVRNDLKDGGYGRTWWINSTNVNASCAADPTESGCP